MQTAEIHKPNGDIINGNFTTIKTYLNETQNLYGECVEVVLSDEDIKKGDFCFDTSCHCFFKAIANFTYISNNIFRKVVSYKSTNGKIQPF